VFHLENFSRLDLERFGISKSRLLRRLAFGQDGDLVKDSVEHTSTE